VTCRGFIAVLGFFVAVVATAASAASAPRLGQAGATYVALGDSYSAGEGLGPFERGTDVKKGADRNQCHRSANDAYPVLVPAVVLPQVSSRAFFACSGAWSSEMQNVPPQTGPNRQVGQPDQIAMVGPRTNYITVTAGGNDVGFGDLGLGCVQIVINHSGVFHLSTTSCKGQVAKSNAKLGVAKASLISLYTKLLTNAPAATIVVLGYPRVLPPSYAGVPTLKGGPFCVLDHYPPVVDVGMPVADARRLDAVSVNLNDTIKQAIAAVRQARPAQASQLRYANSYSSSVPHNCKGTTPGATVTAAQLSLGRGLSGPKIADKLKKSWIASSTLHPTKVGQKLFARLVQEAFQGPTKPPTACAGGLLVYPGAGDITISAIQVRGVDCDGAKAAITQYEQDRSSGFRINGQGFQCESRTIGDPQNGSYGTLCTRGQQLVNWHSAAAI
jgi:lysophospholipase L1-like esterase